MLVTGARREWERKTARAAAAFPEFLDLQQDLLSPERAEEGPVEGTETTKPAEEEGPAAEALEALVKLLAPALQLVGEAEHRVVVAHSGQERPVLTAKQVKRTVDITAAMEEMNQLAAEPVAVGQAAVFMAGRADLE